MINSVEAVLQARKVYHDLHQAYDYEKVSKVLQDWLEENKALAYESNLAFRELTWLYGLSSADNDQYLQQVHEVIERDNLGVNVEDIRVKIEPIPSEEAPNVPNYFPNFEDELDEEYNQRRNAELDKELEDLVNHPSHYQLANGIEAIDLMEMTSTAPEFCGHLRNTALKYIIRAGKKDPRKYVEDLEKAKWYITKLQEFYSKEESKEY